MNMIFKVTAKGGKNNRRFTHEYKFDYNTGWLS